MLTRKISILAFTSWLQWLQDSQPDHSMLNLDQIQCKLYKIFSVLATFACWAPVGTDRKQCPELPIYHIPISLLSFQVASLGLIKPEEKSAFLTAWLMWQFKCNYYIDLWTNVLPLIPLCAFTCSKAAHVENVCPKCDYSGEKKSWQLEPTTYWVQSRDLTDSAALCGGCGTKGASRKLCVLMNVFQHWNNRKE